MQYRSEIFVKRRSLCPEEAVEVTDKGPVYGWDAIEKHHADRSVGIGSAHLLLQTRPGGLTPDFLTVSNPPEAAR